MSSHNIDIKKDNATAVATPHPSFAHLPLKGKAVRNIAPPLGCRKTNNRRVIPLRFAQLKMTQGEKVNVCEANLTLSEAK